MEDRTAGSADSRSVGERRASAMADSVADLIGIFTHDLSNPLQSLTVLLELTLDDLAPGTEAHTKLQQSLDSSERMRKMIRDFAGVTRAGRVQEDLTVGEMWRRASTILRRRFERHKIKVKADLTRIEPARGLHPVHEMVMLAMLMAAMTAASRSEDANFVLNVTGSVPADLGGQTARLEVGLSGHRHVDQTLAVIPLGGTEMQRARDMLGDAPGKIYVHPNESARLEFPFSMPEP